MNSEDKIYTFRKIAVMFTCMLIFVTLGLVVINFQSKIITIDYYGEINSIKTMSNTVEGMLMQNKIYIDDKAIVYPNKDTKLINNMQIKIYSEEEVAKLDVKTYILKAENTIIKKIIEETVLIPFEKETKKNTKLDRSVAKVVQNGENGKKTVTTVVTYNGEKEVSKVILGEKIEKIALKQITEVGTKVSPVSRGSVNRNTSVDGNFKEYNIKLSLELQKHTYNMAKKYNVPYTVLLGLMFVESGYKAEAKSSTGWGICQINPTNLRYLKTKIGTTNLFDPYQNIQAGAYWLSRYYSSWSGEKNNEIKTLHALNSYNWGEGGYRAYLKKDKNRDAYSWRYGKKVLAIRDKLEANGGL